jgi:hypothetical protein
LVAERRSDVTSRRQPHRTHIARLAAFALFLAAGAQATSQSPAGPRFYADDPLWTEPNTQDAAGVQSWDLDLAWDLVENLFTSPGDSATDQRAVNVNTVDEVPNGAWFTNRTQTRPLTPEEVARGANTGTGPTPGRWVVVSAKSDGITPGFTVRDTEGVIWFLKFDPPGWRGMATGTEVTVAKLLWALGYHTPEYYIATLRMDGLDIAKGTKITPPGAEPRQMVTGDLEWLLRQADREKDGSYRVIASRALPGKPLGGFRFYGTRPDDPNDVYAHEHRRELRGYGVFAAWFNHVDAKSINTMDTLLAENGHGFVRHYLLDFGSAMGSAAVGPREYWEGREYLVEPGVVGKGIFGFGFYGLGRRMTPMYEAPSIGRIDRDNSDWDPEDWKPRIPNPAFVRARADDEFWAARKATGITDAMVRAAVSEGKFGAADDEARLVLALIDRRNAIARRYLPAINPIVDPALDAQGRLTFRNAAVDAGVAPDAAQYSAEWGAFDNATGETRPLGEAKGTREGIAAPQALPSEPGAFVRIAVRAVEHQNPEWKKPVHIFFRRAADGWTLVGLDRLPK